MNNKQVDIVLPCYNPVPGWEKRIIQSYTALAQAEPQLSWHFILVNDGSAKGIQPDSIGSLQAALPHFTYIDSPKNQGKGAALRLGVARSQASICLFTDIDFPYTQESLLSLYKPLAHAEIDVAVGVKDEQYYQQLPAFRVRVSRFLRFLARTFLRIPITDTQCGLKGFNEQGKAIFLRTSIRRYLADLEFIFLVHRSGKLRMRPITVQLREDVSFSKVNLSILLREGFNFGRVFIRSWIGR